jgi:hypothetical protein
MNQVRNDGMADKTVVTQVGDVAELDTALPHWSGPAGDRSVEVLSVLSRQGERMQVRAAPAPRTAADER